MGVFNNNLDNCIQLVQTHEILESQNESLKRFNKQLSVKLALSTGAIAVSSYISINYHKPEAMFLGIASIALIHSAINLYNSRPLKGSYKIDYNNLNEIDYKTLRRSQREREFYRGKLSYVSPTKFHKKDAEDIEETFGYESDNDLPIHFLKKEEVPSRLLREYDLYNLKYELPELKISETELTIFIDTLESWLRPLIQAQRIYAYSSDYFKYLYSKGLLNYWDEITIEEIINHLYFLEKDDISLEQIKELQTLLRENLENSKKNSLNK